MSKELWQKLDKIRGFEFRDPKELADLLQKQGIHFKSSELTQWGQILATRFGRHFGLIHVPEWLAGIFDSLIEGSVATTMCDPWAGIGLLVGVVREAAQAKLTLAFTRNESEAALGRVLVPNADWRIGDPFELLDSVENQIDVAVSILPMGAKTSVPLTVPTRTGETVELRDDLGNLLLVAASTRLSTDGVGLFVVTPSFFFSQRSVFRHFNALGLGMEAALALPPGTFAPYTNIPTYLVAVRKHTIGKMFVARLANDATTSLQIVANLKQRTEGGTLDLGRFVDPLSFRGLESIRTAERLEAAEQEFGSRAVRLEELATAINLGRHGGDFEFAQQDNAVFIPLIGISDVVDSVDDLKLKPQNYAQVAINPQSSYAGFVARFLNSELGKEIRELSKTGFIPKLTKQSVKDLRVFVPNLPTQRTVLEIESRIASERNVVLDLEIELDEFRRELWSSPRSLGNVEQRLTALASRLSGNLKTHAVERLDQWFETLPFPLASILRAWQATQSQDFKTKYEHLLHFFEATAEFLSVILLSAFTPNEALFESHKLKIRELFQEMNLSFQRPTFGTWKLVVEYLGKQTRILLSGDKDGREVCSDIFSDPSFALPEAVGRKELGTILSAANKMRNVRSHGGVVSQEEAQLRNEQLVSEVQKLRDAMADVWSDIQLIRSFHCRPRRGMFENEVAVLMGSNSEFLPETRSMATGLDVEHLYISNKTSGRALKLLPLVQFGPSPQSAKNACYFFNGLERDGAHFISYHFTDKPELTGRFDEATQAIKSLIAA